MTLLGSPANLDHVDLLGHSRALDGRRLFSWHRDAEGRDWTTTPADLATSASQAASSGCCSDGPGPDIQETVAPNAHANDPRLVLLLHAFGLTFRAPSRGASDVEAHQSKDNEHNHGAHDPHDAHFGFLSVLFILVWHSFPPEPCTRPFVLTFDFAQTQRWRKFYSFLLTSALRR
jgi:hypothetical protein